MLADDKLDAIKNVMRPCQDCFFLVTIASVQVSGERDGVTILFRSSVQQDGATIIRRKGDLASKLCCAAKLTKGSVKEKIENCIVCSACGQTRHRYQDPECPDFGMSLTETAEMKFKLKAGAKKIRHPTVVPSPCDLDGIQSVYAISF